MGNQIICKTNTEKSKILCVYTLFLVLNPKSGIRITLLLSCEIVWLVFVQQKIVLRILGLGLKSRTKKWNISVSL